MCRLRNYRRHHFHRDLQTQVTRTGPQMKLRKYLQNYSFLILCIEKLHFYFWCFLNYVPTYFCTRSNANEVSWKNSMDCSELTCGNVVRVLWIVSEYVASSHSNHCTIDQYLILVRQCVLKSLHSNLKKNDSPSYEEKILAFSFLKLLKFLII